MPVMEKSRARATARRDSPINGGGDEAPYALLRPLFGRIAEVSSLPDVALRIIRITADPNTAASDLVEVIETDPAIAVRLLKAVNSSYYSVREEVTSLTQAVTLLGFGEIRNLAMSAYVAPLFRRSVGHGNYRRRDLWDHMTGVATVSRYIARLCGLSPQEAYLAGLLHDMGWILLDQYLHKPFCQVLDQLTEETSVQQIERRVLGFDHAALGEFALTAWGLPQSTCAAAAAHHAPNQYQGPAHRMVHLVAMADHLCHWSGRTPLGICGPLPLLDPVCKHLGLEKGHVSQVINQLDEILSVADDLAKMHLV